MGIFLKKRGNGYDPRWHGSWQVDGVRKVVALNLWHGIPPGPGEEEGDAKFERSRGEALRRFNDMKGNATSNAEEVVIAQKIHAARYGEKVGRVKLTELAARWDALPHGKITDGRRARVHSVLGHFAKWMGTRYPGIKDAGALMPKHFREFFADVEKHGVTAGVEDDNETEKQDGKKKRKKKEKREITGVTPRTWNDVLDILRGVLRRVDGQSRGFREYLVDLPKKVKEQKAETVHRRAFTAKELAAIFRAAEEIDPILSPVIVCAACTALRRGDAAQLRWDDVDMESGFVKVNTSKTGEPVSIPIFLPFMAVLREAEKERRPGAEYVFPKVAAHYAESPKWLNRHLAKVLNAAGIKATPAERKTGTNRKIRASLSLWHAFRSTFVTFALANGVAPQIVMQVTGHTTDKTMFQFYDRRAAAQLQAEMRKAFEGAMPRAIAGAVTEAATGNSTGEKQGGQEMVYVPFPPEREEIARLLSEATAEQLAKVERIFNEDGQE